MGALVFIVALRFRCKLCAQSGGNYWSDEFIFNAGHHLRIPRLPANMDAICWGQATKAREPSNEYNPYALALLSKQRTRPIRVSSAQECEGRNSRWQWLCHSPLHCKAKASINCTCSCQYPKGGWGLGGYTSAGAGTQQRLDYEELYESTQQWHDELNASP